MAAWKGRRARLKSRIHTAVGRFVAHHPILGALTLFIALPLALLGAVGACAAAVVLPLAWALGWA